MKLITLGNKHELHSRNDFIDRCDISACVALDENGLNEIVNSRILEKISNGAAITTAGMMPYFDGVAFHV